MSVREMEAMAVSIRETLDMRHKSDPVVLEALDKELLWGKESSPWSRHSMTSDATSTSRFVGHIPLADCIGWLYKNRRLIRELESESYWETAPNRRLVGTLS
jgi:hypothetical protein